MCAPSGDTAPPEASSVRRRGEPPNNEMFHKLAFPGWFLRETSKCESSGNQSSTRAEKFGGRGTEWTSPVRISFRYTPVLSEYARYLPSAETAALLTLFSDEFEVSLRSMMSVGRGGSCQTVQTNEAAMISARQPMAIG